MKSRPTSIALLHPIRPSPLCRGSSKMSALFTRLLPFFLSFRQQCSRTASAARAIPLIKSFPFAVHYDYLFLNALSAAVVSL
jgi:hypothetical protein